MMPPIMDKEKIEKFMQSMMEMGIMFKMLQQPTMVSTDNGIIVAYGNTLRKFDKDLNLVKEIDLDINPDAVQGLASKLSKKYTADLMDLMGGMVPGAGAGAGGGSSYSSPSSSYSSPAASHPSASSGYDAQREAQIKKEIDQMK